MKKLSKKSTEIFQQLVSHLNGEGYLKILNEPYMPLTIERIGKCDSGRVILYSLCHYSQQNGDLMQDPEMCFAVINTDEGLSVYPYIYQQAYLGMYQESISFSDNGKMEVNDELQIKHENFANLWLSNIQSQGFLDQIKIKTRFNFQINTERKEWEAVEPKIRFFEDWGAAVQFAKRLTRFFKAPVRMTNGEYPFRSSGTYFHHQQDN